VRTEKRKSDELFPEVRDETMGRATVDEAW
jgi:hypothetical protein